MQDYKTLKNNLITPMRDKTKLMRLEHLLSNNYVLAGIVICTDVLLWLVLNYLIHLVSSVPDMLSDAVSGGSAWGYLSLRYLFPTGFSSGRALAYLILFAIVDVVLVYRIKTSWSEDNFNVGQKGVARFVTDEEIKEEYTAIEPLETPYPGNPGILVARIGNVFYIDQTVVNNLFIGITRSGKGELFVKPSIEIYSRAENQPSLVINDPKLEHYKVFAKILEKRGYDVYLLNVSNPKYSMGFNLLSVALDYYVKKDYDMAEMVVTSIAHSFFDVDNAVGDMVYFTNTAAALFSAMVLGGMQDAVYADEIQNQKRQKEWMKYPPEYREQHPFHYRHDNEKTVNLYSLILNFDKLVTTPINREGTRTRLDAYFEARPEDDRARLKYTGVEVAPGKTKSGVFSEMLRHLDKFTLYNVGRMTAESTLDMAQIGFGERPVAVFMAVPSYDTSLYKIPTIFIRQMYYVLGKMCDDGKGRCDRQVKVIFDETGNMPEVELMDVMTTMGLGQNISFDLYLQNYEQLDDLYGKETAKTIRSNCGNHFYLLTNSEDTALDFSRRLGNKSRIDVQRAGGKLSLSKYFTESIQDEPLLDMNKLMELQEGECVIARTSKRKDNNGQKIKPRPIFNSVENGRYLWYSYEYFPPEEYPHPNTINFLDVCRESRAHIEPRERVWNIEDSFRILQQKNLRIRRLRDVGYQELADLLRKSVGNRFEEQYGFSPEMTAAEATEIVQGMEIPETEKEVVLMKLAG